jgi:hypothetical protein
MAIQWAVNELFTDFKKAYDSVRMEVLYMFFTEFNTPMSLMCNGYRVFSGGKGGRGVMLATQPFLVPRLRKS